MQKGNIRKVKFDAETHTYSYCGRKLYGVTSAIGARQGKKWFSTDAVKLACSYGTQVHRESENWIKHREEPVTEAGKWVKGMLETFLDKEGHNKLSAEVPVSDFEYTASMVDVVLHKIEGVFLYDIKTNRFDREYCTLQLNTYRVLYENSYNEKVLGMFVLNTKAKRVFAVGQIDDNSVYSVLEWNKILDRMKQE